MTESDRPNEHKPKKDYSVESSKDTVMSYSLEQVKSFSYPFMIHHTLDLKNKITHTTDKMDQANEQYVQMMEFKKAIMAAYQELNPLD